MPNPEELNARVGKNYYAELKNAPLPVNDQEENDRICGRIAAAAKWNMDTLHSPTDGFVIRADAADMSKFQREVMVDALQRLGFSEAKIVHSKTFDGDFVQISETNKQRLMETVARYGSSSGASPLSGASARRSKVPTAHL